jgi:cyclic pyranopterin phosphate synthase
MLDRFGRTIDYLRISVTSRCNLRCLYCDPVNPRFSGTVRHRDNGLMTPEELGTVARTMVKLGVRKIRITGGEPLARADLAEFLAVMAQIPEVEDLALTTNGIGLAGRVRELKAAGLKRVNISIDSLDREQYALMTGGGSLSRVLKGIDAALAAGLTPLKLNVVVLKGINEDQIGSFIELTREFPLDVRFIEWMPVGERLTNYGEGLLLNSEILKEYPRLQPVGGNYLNQAEPAVYYRLPGYRGRVGLISPISQKFCARCNRIRVTYDGKIKSCLGNNAESDFLTALRNRPEQLESLFRKTIFQKPAGHQFDRGGVSGRNMAAIGG